MRQRVERWVCSRCLEGPREPSRFKLLPSPLPTRRQHRPCRAHPHPHPGMLLPIWPECLPRRCLSVSIPTRASTCLCCSTQQAWFRSKRELRGPPRLPLELGGSARSTQCQPARFCLCTTRSRPSRLSRKHVGTTLANRSSVSWRGRHLASPAPNRSVRAVAVPEEGHYFPAAIQDGLLTLLLGQNGASTLERDIDALRQPNALLQGAPSPEAPPELLPSPPPAALPARGEAPAPRAVPAAPPPEPRPHISLTGALGEQGTRRCASPCRRPYCWRNFAGGELRPCGNLGFCVVQP